MESGLEVKGHIAGDNETTGHGLYGGGGYHNAYNNIVLHGDASTGTSGIAFVSDKVAADGTITTINQPSDRAFIQWHASGVTTYTAEGTNPTLATSGETNILMIGVGNDATDQVRIQTPSRTGLLHQVGNAAYAIPDTNNTTGTVGSGTQPVWVEAGVIKNTTYTLGKSVPSNAVFTDTNNAVAQTNQTGNNDYRILLSGTADDTTRTEGSNKSTNLRFNPSTKVFSVGGSISATGDLNLTGDANLNGETYADSMTVGSLLVNGAANFVQIPTSPTPEATSNDTSIATTAFVMNAFTANDAMVFKGVINANSGLPADHKQGWTYRIGTAGTYANKVCEVGDIIICVTDGTAANNDHWAVIQNNVDGAVYRGTNAFTDANIIVADSTAGKVKSSGKTITTTAPASGSADTTIPTSKAVWSAISGASGYGKTGTVTSVQVQASSPLQSSTNTAQSTSLNTTISFTNQNANTILAGPSSGSAAAPTFRVLVAADIPKVNNATTADKLGTADVGSNVKAIYLDDGVAKASDHEFAGGYQKNNADLNTLYDSGFYSCPGGSLTNYPTGGSAYGTILVTAYRKPSGNTTPDYAWQMGNFTQNTDRLWYRTSQASTWRAWRQVVNIATNTAVGNTTTPVYVTADGAVTALSYTIAKSVPSNAVFTDTNNAVKQSESTTADWRKLLLHYKNDAASTTAVTDSTNQVYAAVGISAQPSTGTIRAAAYNVLDKVTLQFNTTTNALDFVFI